MLGSDTFSNPELA
jgi:hypothetical protein